MRQLLCTRCGKNKPATSEYFPPDDRYAAGFQSWCRQCYREYRRGAYRRDPSPDNNQASAYIRASARLRERHRDEFDKLYQQELRKSKVAS